MELDYEPKPPEPPTLFGKILARYRAVPLYARILVAMGLGLTAGLAFGVHCEPLAWGSRIVLRFLGALAPALILVAVVDAIVNANVKGRSAGKLFFLLVLNTTVAICIGLLVANVVRPGQHEKLAPVGGDAHAPDTTDMGKQLLTNLPASVLEPLVTNNVIGVVILALAFGIALRKLRETQDISSVNSLVSLALKAVVVVLHWVIELVPLAVFCTVAATVGVKGFGPFKALAWFIAAVLIALFLQAIWYLVRIRLSSWVSPIKLLGDMSDALVMAFSTSSSTATMPVTYQCLRQKVGLREDSASMGALVGSNFNNDGTALYEAMAALFVAQMTGVDLTWSQQILVVVMSIIASVGAAGIPEAGLVTMTLVFKAVHLPPDYVLLLVPVDWFLDRCRTVINLMGDVNVSCMLEGKSREMTNV